MSYVRIPEHEAYFGEKEYNDALHEYQYQSTAKDFPPQKLLIVAKALFIFYRFTDSLDLLRNFTSSSPKIEYQRLCLLFKVNFLLQKDEIILYCIIEEALKLKIPPHLQDRLETYKKLIVPNKVQKIISPEERRAHAKKIERASSSAIEGFPAYLIAERWYRQLESRNQPVGILSNLEIINDFFETAPINSPEYLDFILFPTQRFRAISRQHWEFLISQFNGQFSIPIKRFYSPLQHHSQRKILYALSPAVVEFNDQNFIFQMPSKARIQRELYPILRKYFGLGNLWRKRVKKLVDPRIRLDQLGGEVLRYEIFESSYNVDQKILLKFLCRFNIGRKPLQFGEGLLGLQNLGNSCYLGACLQCISHTRQLSNFLRKEDLLRVANLENRPCYITFALADLFRELWGLGEDPVVPDTFKRYFGLEHKSFSGKSQQDAHEFLLGLLNTVHQDLRRGNPTGSSMLQSTTDMTRVRECFQRNEGKSKGSVVSDLLRGSLHGTITCGACGMISHSFDSFLALSLSMLFPDTNPIKIYYFCPPSEPLAYELHTQDIKKISDVFSYFKKEVLKNSDPANTNIIYALDSEGKVKKLFCDRDPRTSPIVPVKKEQNGKVNGSENHSSATKNEAEAKLKGIDKAKEEVQPKKEKLLNNGSKITKQEKINEEPKKIVSQNMSQPLWEIQGSVQDLRGENICFIEVPPKRSQNESLTLIQIKKRGERIAFPILKYVQSETLQKFEQLDEEDKKYKAKQLLYGQVIAMNMRDVEIKRQKDKLYEWVIKVDFRENPRLWNEAGVAQIQINYPQIVFELEECLAQLTLPEKIQGWRCGKCNKISNAQKKEQLYQTGNIFIICLKRFKADSRKIKSLFRYPLQGLDLSACLQSPLPKANAIYDLYAVCLHQGTASYGHYRAYCKSQTKDEWFLFDDHLVRSVDPNEVVSSAAYILFYRRRQFII